MIKEMKNYIKVDKLKFVEPIDIDKGNEFKKYGYGDGRIVRFRNFEIPKQAGIYIYYNKNMEVMYIGKATDLTKRYKEHNNESISKVRQAKRVNNDNIKFYSYAICKDVEQAEMMEMIYTRLYKPKLNNYSLRQIEEGKVE